MEDSQEPIKIEDWDNDRINDDQVYQEAPVQLKLRILEERNKRFE